jgi:hypothetical protein
MMLEEVNGIRVSDPAVIPREELLGIVRRGRFTDEFTAALAQVVSGGVARTYSNAVALDPNVENPNALDGPEICMLLVGATTEQIRESIRLCATMVTWEARGS